MNIGTLTGRIELEDSFTSGLDKALMRLETAGQKALTLGQNFTKLGTSLSVGITAPLVAAAGASLAFSGNFEQSMERLVSIAGVGSDELADVRKHILDLAPAVGIGPQALAEAMTKVSSTVSDTATALSILDIAAQGTKAGFGDTVDVAGALTTVLNSYGKENISAGRAADILAQAIKEGGAEARELAPTLANVVPFAAQLGVSFEEVAANIATMTKLGTPTAEAVTSLTSVFTALSKETSQGTDALRAMGLSYAGIRQEVREKGLAAALTDLSERFQGNETAMTDVFGRIEAVKNVMGTAGVQAGTYAQVLESVKRSSEGTTGAMQQMADAMSGKQIQTWKELSAAAQVIAIDLGDKLAPSMGRVLEAARPLLAAVSDLVRWFGELPEPVQTTTIAVLAVSAALGPLLIVAGQMATAWAALTPFLTSATIAFTAMAFPIKLLISQIQIFGVQVGVSTTAVWIFDNTLKKLWASMLAHPIVAVAAAIGVITVATVKWYQSSEEARLASEELAFKQDAVNRALSLGAEKGIKYADAVKFIAEWNRKAFGGALELEDAISRVGNKSGDTNTQLVELNRSVLDAGSKGKLSTPLVNQVAQAIAGMSKEALAAFPALKNVAAAADIMKTSASTSAASTKTLTQELAESRKALAALSDQDKKNIQSGRALSMTADAIAESTKLSAGAVQLYVDQLDESKKKSEEAAEKQKKFQESVRTFYQTVLSGIPALQTYKSEINGVLMFGEDYSRMLISSQIATDSTGRAIKVNLVPSLGNLGKGLIDVTTNGKEFIDQIGSWADQLTRLSQVSGDSFGGIVKDIAEIVVSYQMAADAANDYSKATTTAGKALALLQGATAVMSATKGGGAKGIAGGALAGAQMGSVFGPWGTAIGAGVGALIGIFRSRKGEFAKIGREYGTEFSEELIKQLKADKDRLGGQMQSVVANLDKIVSEAGGIESFGVDRAVAKLRDVFVLFENDALDAAEAVKVLDKNFASFATASTDNLGILSVEMREIIRLNDRLGTQSREIAEYQSSQATAAAKDLARALEIPNTALESYDELFQKQVELKAQIDKNLAIRPSRRTKRDDSELAELRKEYNEIVTDLNKVGPLFDITAVKSQEAASAIASSITGIVAANMQAGMTFTQAVGAAAPAVDALEKQLSTLGFSGGAAFDLIKQQVVLARDAIAGPALEAIHGYSSGLVGLSNAGLLNQDIFSGLTSQIQGTASALVEQGFDSDAVMLAMKDDLQTIWKLQKDYGFALDDTTQKMVDQAVEAGVVGEQHKSSTELMIEASQRMVEVLEAMATFMGVTLPSKAESGAGRVVDALGEIEDSARDVEDAVNGIVYGHSPGGLKEIEPYLLKTQRAFKTFGGDAEKVLNRVSREVDNLASKTSKIKAPKWTSAAKEEKTDLERDIKLLSAGSDFERDKLQLKFAEQDEIKALKDRSKELGSALPELLKLVGRKYDLEMAQLVAEQAERVETSYAGGGTPAAAGRPTVTTSEASMPYGANTRMVGSLTIPVFIDGREVGRAIVPHLPDEIARQTGRAA